jgi:hypothetical protein
VSTNDELAARLRAKVQSASETLCGWCDGVSGGCMFCGGTGLCSEIEHRNSDILAMLDERDRLRALLLECRKKMDLPGLDECDDPDTCPWACDHALIRNIDEALK